MSLLDVVRYRVRVLLRPTSFAREREEEIRHHLDLEAADARSVDRASSSDAEIERHARRQFGNLAYSSEERRMIAGLALFDAVRQDVAFVVRFLRRRAAFAAVSVSTIALGIGAATSLYSVADAVLFRPLAFPDADRLTTVWLTRPRWKTNPALSARWDRGTLSLTVYRDWRASQTSFANVAVWMRRSAVVGGSTAPEEVSIVLASASLLPTLGIRPELGAWFSAADDIVGGAPVAVVSHETWAARTGSDPHIVGEAVDIDGVRHIVVGVLPAGVSLDRTGGPIAYWIPAGRDPRLATDPGAFAFQAIGRLKPTVSLAAASAEAQRFFGSIAGDDRIKGAVLASLHADQTRTVRRPLVILLAAAGLLLLIACINVATLLMGEAVSREPELRTRAALGASRARLFRQLLTESIALASAGAVAGTALAFGATRLIVRSAPAPALSLTRPGQLASDMKHTTRGRGRGQRNLIACEVALSMVLLVAAGLLARSFSKLSSVGFRPSELLVASLRLPKAPFDDSAHVRAVYGDLLERLKTRPGVIAVAATTTPPFSNGSSSGSFEIEGRPVTASAPTLDADRRATSPEFFVTAGIPIVAGRAYSDADRAGAPLVMVVSRVLARREWPAESAIGKRIKFGGEWRTIIGVAGDIETERPTAEPTETIYVPLAQMMLRSAPAVLVRTHATASDAVSDIRQTAHDVEADVSVSRVDDMSDLVAAALADDRLRTVLIVLFAAIAGLLAAVGMYGVAATSANRRTREMAIRVAVGASSGSVARLIIGTAARGVVLGATLGVGPALAGTRVLAPYLYDVRVTDPVVYAIVGFSSRSRRSPPPGFPRGARRVCASSRRWPPSKYRRGRHSNAARLLSRLAAPLLAR